MRHEPIPFDDLVTILRDTPRMLLMDERFATTVAALMGFENASATDEVDRFSAWMRDRHPGYGNYVFWALVMREAFPDRTEYPPPASVEEDEAARQTLFSLLAEWRANEA